MPLAPGCGSAHPGSPLAVGSPARLPQSRDSHVIVIVMENAEYAEVIGSPVAPYVNELARRYGLATRSYAITHPSLPNYLALSSGSTEGVSSDCTDCHFSDVNIVDQLERAGITTTSRAPRPAAASSPASRGWRRTCAPGGFRPTPGSPPTSATTATTAASRRATAS